MSHDHCRENTKRVPWNRGVKSVVEIVRDSLVTEKQGINKSIIFKIGKLEK